MCRRTLLFVPDRAKRRGSESGFTLVEILVVVMMLGLLAAIVIPQFSTASHQARQNALKDDLRSLRLQVQLYSAQHRNVAPGFPAGDPAGVPTEADFVDQMTLYTDADGFTNAVPTSIYRYGPYMRPIPANPLNHLATVLIVDNGSPMPVPDDSTGWIYKPQTKEIIANLTGVDTNDVPFTSY